MQQGRQECRPSDGPATPLSPMVATKACFAPPPPTLLRNSHCKSLMGKESCFFPSGPKLVLVGGLPGSRGDKSVAHPTDRRHSCRRWWPRRRASLPHHPPSRAPMKQLMQVVGGPEKLFLPVGAKTCFGGWALQKKPWEIIGSCARRGRFSTSAVTQTLATTPSRSCSFKPARLHKFGDFSSFYSATDRRNVWREASPERRAPLTIGNKRSGRPTH